MSVGNLTRVVAQIDNIDWQEGMIAYPRYRETMQRLGSHYGYSAGIYDRRVLRIESE